MNKKNQWKVLLVLILTLQGLSTLAGNFTNSYIVDEDLNHQSNSYYTRSTLKDSSLKGSRDAIFVNSYLLETHIADYNAETLLFRASSLTFFNMNNLKVEENSFLNSYWSYGKLEGSVVERLKFESSHLRAVYIKNIESKSFSLTRSSLYLSDVRSSKFEKINFRDVKINKSKLIDLNIESGNIYKGVMNGGKWNISTFANISLSHFKFNNMQFKSNRFTAKSSLMHVTFTASNLESTEFKETRLENVTIKGSNVLDLKFISCELRDVNFIGVDIKLVKFVDTKFNNVRVNGALFNGH